MSHALYEFMPYGAPDLISEQPRRLFRATLSSAALWMVLLTALTIVVLTRPKPVVIDTRDCPFCMSKMALKATRCPACTSEVKPAA